MVTTGRSGALSCTPLEADMSLYHIQQDRRLVTVWALRRSANFEEKTRHGPDTARLPSPRHLSAGPPSANASQPTAFPSVYATGRPGRGQRKFPHQLSPPRVPTQKKQKKHGSGVHCPPNIGVLRRPQSGPPRARSADRGPAVVQYALWEMVCRGRNTFINESLQHQPLAPPIRSSAAAVRRRGLGKPSSAGDNQCAAR